MNKLITAAILTAASTAHAYNPGPVPASCNPVGIFDIDGDGKLESVCLDTFVHGSGEVYNTGDVCIDGTCEDYGVKWAFEPTNVCDENGDYAKDICGYRQWQGGPITFEVVYGIHSCEQIDDRFLDYGTYPDGDLGNIYWRMETQNVQAGEAITITYPNGTSVHLAWDGSNYPVSCDAWNCKVVDGAGYSIIPPGMTWLDIGITDAGGNAVRQCVYRPE